MWSAPTRARRRAATATEPTEKFFLLFSKSSVSCSFFPKKELITSISDLVTVRCLACLSFTAIVARADYGRRTPFPAFIGAYGPRRHRHRDGCGRSPPMAVVVLSHDPILDPSLTRLTRRALDRCTRSAWLREHRLFADRCRGFDVGRIRPGTAQAVAFPGQQAMDGHQPPVAAPRRGRPSGAGGDACDRVEDLPGSPRLDGSRPRSMADAVLAVLDRGACYGRGHASSPSTGAASVICAASGRRLSLGYLTEAPDDRRGPALVGWVLRHEDFGGSVPRAVAAQGGTVWGPDVRHADTGLPSNEAASRWGLLVNPWAVNDPDNMRRLIGWGVGALTTDYPDRARGGHGGDGRRHSR